MEKVYWIWLQCALGCGSAVADLIVKQNMDPAQLYHSSEEELLKLSCFTDATVRKLKQTPLAAAQDIMRRCEEKHIWILVPTDEDYPERLKHIYQIPLVLYGIGNGSLLNETLLITVVGTRRASPNGVRVSGDLAHDLAQYGFGIVSGMALGIDSAAHQGALDAGGLTIGVAGCGLDVSYPSGNVELRRNIARKGVMITEYPPGTEVRGSNFPVRNRILAGLSLGTAVVEAPKGSGSLITADLALEQGRDVFALPSDLYNRNGAGNLQLLRQGATIVLSPESVVEEYSALYGDRMKTTIHSRMSLQKGHKPAAEHKQTVKEKEVPHKEAVSAAPSLRPILDDLEPHKREILEKMTDKPLHAEELALLCGMELFELLAELSELEIDGLVKAYPGKQFGR